ncbi:MAG: rane protein [Candidatus Paceibacter sp.]|jgi:hypothetical protein|nr:rane protein [Candidatus Paceibacter sp.]
MIISLVIVLIIGFIVYASIKPSNDRDWSPDQAILPYADIKGDTITIHNIRNYTYRSTTDYTPGYYDATYNLKDLEKMYFIDEPFSGFAGAAHTFLSFEFKGDKFLSISTEIRKEKGEKFSAIKGLFKQFELMYVVGDERDLIKLRTNYRKDDVYLYPLTSSPEKAQAVFVHMLNRINNLQTEPEFYNTLINNCTNNIARHANEITPGKVPWSYTFIFPKNADKHAFKLGLIDTTETNFEKVRQLHLITPVAQANGDSADFSLKIRGRK